MDKFEQRTKALIAFIAETKGIRYEEVERNVSPIAKNLARYLSEPQLPAKKQTLAVAGSKPMMKTSALFFDRVWDIPGSNDCAPDDIIAFGATEQEFWLIMLVAASQAGALAESEFLPTALRNPLTARVIGPDARMLVSTAVSGAIAREFEIPSTAVYPSQATCDAELKSGSTASLVAIIDGLQVVDEKKLTWEHVREIRKDEKSKSQIRRLRHWIDTEMVNKPVSYVVDEINIRLEQYESALAKHGIKTFAGVISDLLDEKFLTGTASVLAAAGLTGGVIAGAAAGGTVAALVGGGLAIGRATLSIAQRLLDLDDRPNAQGAEIAFVHELKKLPK